MVGHFWVRYQKIREKTKKEERKESLFGELIGNHLKGIKIASLGASYCRISIPPQQQVDCKHSLVTIPLTELYLPQK